MGDHYIVQTFGCQMNEHDSERISGLLEESGLQRTSELDEANVIVLNTCCIRENADNKFYGHLGNLKQLKEQNPDLKILVGGCLAQKDQDQIRERAKHVDVVFGTHNLNRVVDLLDLSKKNGPIVEIVEPFEIESDSSSYGVLPVRRELEYAAWMTIQSGCDNSCAFCIVPQVRGPEVSRPFEDLVQEASRIVSDGVIEITLLGQNVNSYGRDITTRLRSQEEGPKDQILAGPHWPDQGRRRARPLFANLLQEIGSIPGISRVRFTSPHPKDFKREVIDVMAKTPAVCEHLHLPLQSGSDRILASMHRGYNVSKYLERIHEARRIIPDLAVTTDIIVGFPGETEKDFEETLAVAAEAEYDSAYTFVFSPRPGTEASEMTADFCNPDIVSERYERLRTVVLRSGLRKHQERVGRNEEIIVEGPSKKNASVMTGRTRQNKLIHFESEKKIPIGSVAVAQVVEASSRYLRGELVEVLETPKRKMRIPVVAV
ncbi:MAG: MiaB/RimO family radical SAM methylthiotransferase [Acidimicrobiales bacterium]|nr:MiaB/RimO family radical SAM methylthiotransferase [Acidimicrobiales bacterium]